MFVRVVIAGFVPARMTVSRLFLELMELIRICAVWSGAGAKTGATGGVWGGLDVCRWGI